MSISPVRMPAVQALDALSTASTKRATEAPSGGSSFASLIEKSLAQVNSAQSSAESMSHQFQLNPNGDVSLEDAMISLQKANISFQTTVQVRNKLVAAYNDIMNMQL